MMTKNSPSCLDKVRALYAEYPVEEIVAAIAQYRKEQEEKKELESLLAQKEEIDAKLVKFRRPSS